MNKLRIRLNGRKRFVFSAAMAAVFLLLAGGANALANQVWCVPTTSLNLACTALTTKAHIQDAVTAASSNDIIVVGPGYYNETVSIPSTKNILSLFGAQAGKDAREDRHNSAKESIVDASKTPYGSGGGAAFLVEAANVVIDGFTIEGGGSTTPLGADASGIFVNGIESTQVLNNIIQNNAVGVYLYGSGPGLVEYNLFKTNNKGAAGSSDGAFAGMAGFGIAGIGTVVTAITENEFKGNWAAAIDLLYGAFMEVTKNTSEKDGSFAVFIGSEVCFFSHNQGQDFGAQGFLPIPLTTPSGPADAAIDVGNGSVGLQINDNDLEEGKTSGYNGIAFSTIFGAETACALCQVSNNRIKRFAGNGIVAEASSGTGTLYSSGISGNDVEDNGNDGILIEAATSSNSNNSLVDNEAEGNRTNDCEDDTYLIPSGPGTAGTYNTWFNNIGSLSVPTGLCAPGRRHDHD